MNTQPIIDLIEPEIFFTIEEASGDVDGKHVLGKVKGEFFVPNGVSRNKRFYPRELWEKVCANPEVQKKLGEKRVFGTIGHEQKLNDDALRDGKISHIVTNLCIEGSKGMGEALILDTPAGRILNTFLRAGSKLFVSSRAHGTFRGEENGVPKVDPDTYQFESVDFVVDPGFYQANPKLVESLEEMLTTKDNVNNNLKGDEEMDKLVESLAKENGTLKADLERSVQESEGFKAERTVILDENNLFKQKQIKLESNTRLLDKYRNLGTPEEVSKVFEKSEKSLKAYQQYGSAAEIGEALAKAKVLIERYKALGTPAEIGEAFNKSVSVVQSYKKLGTPAEINTAFDKMESVSKKLRGANDVKKIVELAKELKVSEDAIKKVWGKMPEKEIREFFKSLGESAKITSTFRKGIALNEDKTKGKDSKLSIVDQSPGQRLMETFSK